MSISPVSISYSTLQSSSGSSRRQDFAQLANALQSGNLQIAQQAFASLEQLQGGQASSSSGGLTTSSTSGPGTTGPGTTGTNPLAEDFAALGQALSSGNLSQVPVRLHADSDGYPVGQAIRIERRTNAGARAPPPSPRGRRGRRVGAAFQFIYLARFDIAGWFNDAG